MRLEFIKKLEKEQLKLKHKKSVFSNIFKEKIINFSKKFEKSEYMECEMLDFPFFEDYYYAIIKDLIKNNINFVIDIGCNVGLQSELFLKTNIKYLGIEKIKDIHFNEECENVNYKSDDIMNVNVRDKVCISSMSIGYFSYGKFSEDNYIDKLSQCKRLYIVSRKEIIDKLKLKMKLVDKLHNVYLEIEKVNKDISDGYVYVFEKK